jgi:fructose-specific phosphotransferase system component IIB
MAPQTLMKAGPSESVAVTVGANGRIGIDKEVVVMDRARRAKMTIAVKLKEGRP